MSLFRSPRLWKGQSVSRCHRAPFDRQSPRVPPPQVALEDLSPAKQGARSRCPVTLSTVMRRPRKKMNFWMRCCTRQQRLQSVWRRTKPLTNRQTTVIKPCLALTLLRLRRPNVMVYRSVNMMLPRVDESTQNMIIPVQLVNGPLRLTRKVNGPTRLLALSLHVPLIGKPMNIEKSKRKNRRKKKKRRAGPR